MMVDFLLGLVYAFGYLGVFLGSLLGSATILLPVPSFILIFVAGSLLNPFAVGIIAGIGSAIGELTSYAVGRGLHYGKNKLSDKRKNKPKGREIFRKNAKWIKRFNVWFHSKYGFVLIVIFAATPLPDDVLGLYCGAIKYNWKKFFAASLIGKIILSLLIAYAGYYGLEFLAGYLS
jgi:membrane protein DedA with SNARE-associated domain